eukprot:TRINITY_DN11508_c0_g1_i2.p1 TRINITY_DN11508_c0_g1~~TRINITY_DN11508_c0_g1_i2.p1  ORF type:complete len:230 (-),score=22.79 TRINITY_DN11508_c0_g1_i2:91-780(-)
MAKSIVKEHEEEFSRISAEITVLCGKLKHSSTIETTEDHCKELDSLILDADETLEQLELESHNLESGKEKLTARLTSYRIELDRLRGVFRSCRREAEERSARIQLLNSDGTNIGGGGGDNDYVDIKETDGLLSEASDMIQSSDNKLDDGRRLLRETEDIGATVLSDLHNQRETIERSRARLRDVESGLGQSHAVINRMMFRARQNILLLYVVGGVICVAFLIAIYYLVM